MTERGVAHTGCERSHRYRVEVVRFDTSLPLIVLKVGRYPRDHAAVGAIRSLGRMGIPTYAITEDRLRLRLRCPGT